MTSERAPNAEIGLGAVPTDLEFVRLSKYVFDFSDAGVGSTDLLGKMDKQQPSAFLPKTGAMRVEIKAFRRVLKKEFQVSFICFLDKSFIGTERRPIAPRIPGANMGPVVFLPV